MNARARMRAWYLKNRDRIVVYKKAWYLLNRDEIRAHQKARDLAYPGVRRAYYLKNRKRIRARQKAYRLAHRDEIRAKARAKAEEDGQSRDHPRTDRAPVKIYDGKGGA